jgi:para-aminobenzoate synthetase component 1
MNSREISLPSDPADLFQVALETDSFPALFESAAPHPRFGRSTLFASNPSRVLLFEGDRLTLYEAGAGRPLREDPFEALERLVSDGGAALCAGWIGYDLGRFVERLPRRARNVVRMPELFFAAYDTATLIQEGRARRIEADSPREPALDPAAYRRLFGRPRRGLRLSAAPESNFSRRGYVEAIRAAQERIAAGDIYEINLSQRFSAPAEAGPAELYRRLRAASPAWYASAIALGARFAVGSSPEEFLRFDGAEIRTRPIKGTRPRGATPEEDRRLAEELAASPKDDAELAMIVDLSRNDLGRVCEFGTIQVREAKAVERHATVHHLSAEIAGRRRPDVGLARALWATFPGGSVTGAPKIRAMEIIDELEPDRRGVYTGALGFLAPGAVSGTLSMVIRTALYDGGRLHYQTGGAIVADSDPEAEYEETLVKAAGFFRALGAGAAT